MARSLRDIQAELDARRNEYETGKISRKQFQLYERDLATEGSYHAGRTGRRKGRKTAHVPAGHANGGQFTGESNPPSGQVKPKRQRKRKTSAPAGMRDLVPVVAPSNSRPLEKGPDGELNAYGLRSLYGSKQLRDAYEGYTLATLKEHAREVQKRNPGTAPRSWANKKDVTDYIVGTLNGSAPAKAAPKTKRPRKGEPGYAPPVRKRKASAKAPDNGPIPIPIRRGTPEQMVPYGSFDPYRFEWQYGREQLRSVLIRGTQRDLREAVGIVEQRTGTKAPNKTRKADMIDYIVSHVGGSGSIKASPKPKAAPKPKRPRKGEPGYVPPVRKRKASAQREGIAFMWEDEAPQERKQREARKFLGKRTRFDIWRERNPNRPRSEYVPRQGKRAKRTRAQATVEYLDARGEHARRRRRG